MIREKAATLLWYLERPPLYRELGRRITNFRITTKRERERAAADKEAGRAWCEEHRAEHAELLEALGIDAPLQTLAAAHPDWWQQAHDAVDACPVKMGGPAATDLLYHLTRHLPAKAIIETGVANGWSSLAFLAAMADNGGGRLISIDMPYAKMKNEAYVGCAVPHHLRGGSWSLRRLPDRDALPSALAELGTLDLAHHDSDKSYAGRMFVYEQCWDRLRAGGLMMSDDVEDNLAFRDFAGRVGRKPYVFYKKPGNYSGALIK